MNKQIAKKADKVFGGHYSPSEKRKHKIADQMNNMLCLIAEVPDEVYGSDLRQIVERLAELEEIPFQEAA